MEELIALLGVLFFMFLVLSTAVEVILESLRGILEWWGFQLTKSKMSLEDALAMSSEFTDGNATLAAKIQAVASTARQMEKKSADAITKLEELGNKFNESTKDNEKVQEVMLKLNTIATEVKATLKTEDRKRVFLLRTISALIGMALIASTKLYVFVILAQNEVTKEAFSHLDEPWINIVVGGLAAAAGSSFWHDQLNKVRKLKGVSKELKKLQSA